MAGVRYRIFKKDGGSFPVDSEEEAKKEVEKLKADDNFEAMMPIHDKNLSPEENYGEETSR